MTRFAFLTPTLAVAGTLTAADFSEAARQGFGTIINNRPDGEEAGQLTAHEEAAMAWRAGVAYRFVPAAKHEVLDDHVLTPFKEALGASKGPVLLHCRSGLRSTIMWAAIAVESGRALDDVIAAAANAGIDLEPVRAEISERASANSAWVQAPQLAAA